MSASSFLGYLTWWTIPDCAVPYAELNDLATQVGFPSDCVPTPPAPRHAWEKATNVGGTRGLKLDVPTDLINQTYIQYGVEPAVRLLTRRVSDAAPILRRHLVREAVIPVSPDHWKQLSLQTVAVLEFNCRNQCSAVDFVLDAEGWTNGRLDTILDIGLIDQVSRHVEFETARATDVGRLLPGVTRGWRGGHTIGWKAHLRSEIVQFSIGDGTIRNRPPGEITEKR